MTKVPPAIPAPPASRVRWLPWLILLYSNAFSAPFIFDDHDSIVTNPHIRRLWPIWEAMRTPKYSTVSRRPIVCLTLALNYAVGQLHVQGYHAVNLLIHALSALALFGDCPTHAAPAESPTLFAPGGAVAGRDDRRAVAVHPILTESVTYVVQRTELVMGLGLLLALYALIRSHDVRLGRAAGI